MILHEVSQKAFPIFRSQATWRTETQTSCQTSADWVPHVRCESPYCPGGVGAFRCGKCRLCRISRKSIWSTRIQLEAMQHDSCTFVTLTYGSDIPDGSLVPEHVRDWLKRLRFQVAPRKLRYFLVGEYGDRSWRPHYHVALFGLGPCAGGPVTATLGSGGGRGFECQCVNCSLVRNTWGFGHVTLGELNEKTANYIAGYVMKKMNRWDDVGLDGRHPEFVRMSTKPGIGASAMKVVADSMVKHGHDKCVDVPVALNRGRKRMPLGCYLRRRLRKELGRDEKCPDEVLVTSAINLWPLYEAAKAVTAAPGMARFARLVFRDEIAKANYQIAANATAKWKIYGRRTL